MKKLILVKVSDLTRAYGFAYDKISMLTLKTMRSMLVIQMGSGDVFVAVVCLSFSDYSLDRDTVIC